MSTLKVNAEYTPDGDITMVDVYVVVGTTAKPQTIASGTCALMYGTTVLATASIDRSYGNNDGPVKVSFSHPAFDKCTVRTSVTLTDGTVLTDTTSTTVLPTQQTNTAGN